MSSVPTAEVYLAPDFDVNSLKVAQLRGILLQYNVSPSATAKKADLVSLFEDNVRSKATKILKKQTGVKPSSAGITEIGNDGHPVEPPAASTKRPRQSTAKRGRKSAMPAGEIDAGFEAGGEDEGLDEESEPSVPRRQSRRVSTTPSAHQPSTEPPSTSRTGRRSAGPNSSSSTTSVSGITTGMKKSVSAPSGLLAPDESRKGLKKVPSVSVLREESEPEEDEERGGVKVGKNLSATTAPEGGRKKPQVSNEESGFSDANPFQSGGEGGSNFAASMKDRKKRKSLLGGPDRRRSDPSAPSTSTVMPKAFTQSEFEQWQTDPPSSPISGTGKKPSPMRKVAPTEDKLKAPPKAWIEKMLAEKKSNESLGESNPSDVDVDIKVSESIQPSPTKSAMRQPAALGVDGSSHSSGGWLKPAILLGILASSGFRLWQYQMESSSIGYCDTGSNTNGILLARHVHASQLREQRLQKCEMENSRLQEASSPDGELLVCDGRDWLDIVPHPDACTACPVLGMCEDGKLLNCAEGYLEERPLMTFLNPVLNGLPFVGPVAFPSRCILDSAVAELANAIAIDLETELATGKGQIVCNSANLKDWWKVWRKASGDRNLPEAEVYGEKENDVRARYIEKRNDDIYTEAAWEKALDDAIQDLVMHGNLKGHIDEFGTSYLVAARAIMPWQCRAKLAALQRMANYRTELSGITLAIALLIYLKRKFQARSKEDAKVKQLIELSLKRLQDQDFYSRTDDSKTTDPWIAPAQLRDLVLVDDHNIARRQRLWSKVEPIVHQNANVQSLEKVLSDGEVWELWQWVGVPKVDEGRHVTWG